MQKYASARTTRTRTIVLHKKKHFTILKNKPVPLPQLTIHIFKVEEIQIKTRKSPFKIDKPNYAHRSSIVWDHASNMQRTGGDLCVRITYLWCTSSQKIFLFMYKSTKSAFRHFISKSFLQNIHV
jgi:hypothetical protein